MPIPSQLLVGAALALPLSAQNFVTNGDFSNGLTGWTQNGYSCVNGVQTYDVDGQGPSQSHYCLHRGQAVPFPYPPNTLEQNVLLVPGPSYEFSCDVAVYGPVSNADGGTVFVEVNGIEIARVAFDSIGGNEVKRAKLCTRLTTTVAGMQPLKINFQRMFLCNPTVPTPRATLDNVSIQFAVGPTFALRGNLKIGTPLTAVLGGPPGAPFAIFVAPVLLPNGLLLPGIAGTLFLDPLWIATFFTGTFDANGSWSIQIGVPPETGLTLAPTWFQAAHIASGAGALGLHYGFVFVR